MTTCVIDSSAILTFVFGEPGAEAASDWLDRGATASTVILQEVATKLRQRGFTPADAAEAIGVLGLTVADHTLPLALAAADLYAGTRARGLSHGDRSCLALAAAMGLPALTADKAWSELGEVVEVTVEQVR
ncbi:type II toxin-antitoxin system VapC family toxin [uncultured Jannaschia sp.]|uniref:type II toxin-antitoxin system VapC family toxin n=1 Tax=uncultured Jannaschia sp. TaxID=293347 RepID=UPI00261F9CAD|nr:type II toxin-antitoxin system VapC family toxin [uncultured Jannaschia sp.]